MELKQNISLLNYFTYIDGLRAIAILSVISYHISPTKFSGGFIGVDVFFVISGFLISKYLISELATKNTISLFKFYQKRIIRIFPALFTVLSSLLVYGWFIMPPDEFKEAGKQIFSGAAFVSNITFWKEAGYFDSTAIEKPLLNLWSLGIEEQFYILWPLILICIWKYKKLNLIHFILYFIGISFLLNIIITMQNPVAAFYLPYTRFWEFMIGSLLAAAQLNKSTKKFECLGLSIKACSYISPILAGCGLGLISCSVFLINRTSVFPGWWALLPTIGTALILGVGSDTWIHNKILSNKILRYIGLISYPLYLWHWPLYSLACNYLSESARVQKISAVILSFILASLTYHLIERPVRFGSVNKKFSTIFLIFLSIIVATIGMNIYLKNGLPSRFPEIVNLISKNINVDQIYRYKKCFLDSTTQNEKSFSSECKEIVHDKRKTVFIWGDSHAAHLYPGLKKLQEKYNFNIVQYTASSCPPLIGYEVNNIANCERINHFVLNEISTIKPDVIILATRWETYPNFLDKDLIRTSEFLHKLHIEHILVYGPPYKWIPNLKKVLLLHYLRSGDVPSRLKPDAANYSAISNMDNRLKNLSIEGKMTYISTLHKLCNQNGCLTRANSAKLPDSLISPDYDHFTLSGSEYIIENTFFDNDNILLPKDKK